jgi:hypothetical protein
MRPDRRGRTLATRRSQRLAIADRLRRLATADALQLGVCRARSQSAGEKNQDRNDKDERVCDSKGGPQPSVHMTNRGHQRKDRARSYCRPSDGLGDPRRRLPHRSRVLSSTDPEWSRFCHEGDPVRLMPHAQRRDRGDDRPKVREPFSSPVTPSTLVWARKGEVETLPFVDPTSRPPRSLHDGSVHARVLLSAGSGSLLESALTATYRKRRRGGQGAPTPLRAASRAAAEVAVSDCERRHAA